MLCELSERELTQTFYTLAHRGRIRAPDAPPMRQCIKRVRPRSGRPCGGAHVPHYDASMALSLGAAGGKNYTPFRT
ncbi:hypothetical protein KDH_65170 [Dictyobacter sp. S3.2.2.5]|uniref:Uncharacterized protein n=1 Tax=Dictyobacter halimunensis TaxID=3026934 RepID=A0ABQ6G4G8_9CHLR|nr:hypothetical protein KDH_65170 [Dictyobacter sp. S3.2.2.5]